MGSQLKSYTMLSNELTTFITDEAQVEEPIKVRLGKAHAVGRMSTLQFGEYFKKSDIKLPKKFNAYQKRTPIPVQDWGNNEYGCCTIASQGVLSQYMERQEQKKTPVITAAEAVRVYKNMIVRKYGGVFQDMGAYEVDALNNWRNPDYTFRDSKGHPYTIDAYVKINHTDVEEIRQALYLSKAKGIKICFALPYAWSFRRDLVWDIPKGQSLTGAYVPYSWGGHSMTAIAIWDEQWLYGLPHTWNLPMGRISWEAVAVYADEAYLIIDSMNQWRKDTEKGAFAFNKLAADVNDVSSIKIA